MKVRYVLAALCGMLLTVTALTFDDDRSNDLDDMDEEFMDMSSDGSEEMWLDKRSGGGRADPFAMRRRQNIEIDDDMLDEPIFDELQDTSSDPLLGLLFGRGWGGRRRGWGGHRRGWGGRRRGWGGRRRGWGGYGRGRYFDDDDQNHDVSSEDVPEELMSDGLDEIMLDPQGWRGRGGWGGRGGGRGGWAGRGGWRGRGGWGGRGGWRGRGGGRGRGRGRF